MQNTICDRLYATQDIPGRGRGLVAATSIAKGTRIISESLLFEVARDGTSKKRIHASISEKFAALKGEQRQAFLSLHNSFEEDGPVFGRVRTNALPLGPGAITGGIFLESSRINHSCNPNAQNNWNENLQKLTIHAARDIRKGEEITIFYLGARPNRRARLFDIQTSFHFVCSCSLCSLPLNQRKTNDERLDEMERLDRSIGDGTGILSAPLKTLHEVHKLLSLLADEGFTDASVPRAYYDAFQVAITHGDIARARVFAERAASTRAILEGNDSPNVQRMESLSRDPSQHMAYGLSQKWSTTGGNAPEELTGDEFERWLWRKETTVVLQYADLRSATTFPSFDELPEENDINEEFYENAGGSYYRPRKHWCFLAEITDIENFLHLRLIVKDQTGCEIPIAFYTDDRGSELNPLHIRKGFTIAVLYAEQHWFLDMSVGIRHENPAAVKIFPLSLSDLLALSDRVQQYAVQMNSLRTCHGCHQKAANLKKCARCNLFWYCNESCQASGWKENGHKADCKVLKDPDLQKLFRMNWNVFEHYNEFSTRV